MEWLFRVLCHQTTWLLKFLCLYTHGTITVVGTFLTTIGCITFLHLIPSFLPPAVKPHQPHAAYHNTQEAYDANRDANGQSH
jgi:hypothetical protein